MKKANNKKRNKEKEIEVINEEKDENNNVEINEDIKEENNTIEINEDIKSNKWFSNFLLILSVLCFIAYTTVEIINFDSFLNFIPKLLGIVFIFLFLICFIVISFKNKKRSITTIIGCLLIIIYSVFNILLTLKVINMPNDEYIPNFYNKSIKDLTEWNKKYNIEIKENYEYSDKITKYNIISQDKLYPELVKNVNELNITVSLGPDLEKEIIVPNFVGKKVDEFLEYVDTNFLSNVKITYEPSEKDLDTIISQEGNGSLRRNSPIKIVAAKSFENGEVEIIDLTNKTQLYALSWLEKNGFKVNLLYDFNDQIEAGHVISQSTLKEIKNPETDEITLTISKGKMMLAPDIASMKTDEINEWIIDNNLKVSYKEEYSDTTKLGDVITSSIKENEAISSGDKIEITISKGALVMIKVNNINDFINWATTNDVDYQVNYEYSDSFKKDEIIKTSHKQGETIKKDDTVIVTVSKGKSIVIPNFVGMSKSNIQTKCQQINLNCSFKTGSKTEKTAKDIAISQSKGANTTVSEGTSLVITLSAGIIEKVNVPNFSGKTKAAISNECKSLGITCNFNYQSGYSSIEKDTAVSQSKTGTVNKGSSINITLSNGPAKTYNIIIDANQLSSGNANATKATLEKKLKNACPGVNFNFKLVKANSGIGYLSPNSDVKVGSNKLVQGRTYNVIINSN